MNHRIDCTSRPAKQGIQKSQTSSICILASRRFQQAKPRPSSPGPESAFPLSLAPCGLAHDYCRLMGLNWVSSSSHQGPGPHRLPLPKLGPLHPGLTVHSPSLRLSSGDYGHHAIILALELASTEALVSTSPSSHSCSRLLGPALGYCTTSSSLT